MSLHTKSYPVIVTMGGGIILKVGGGTSASQKNYRNFLWFESATAASQVLKI